MTYRHKGGKRVENQEAKYRRFRLGVREMGADERAAMKAALEGARSLKPQEVERMFELIVAIAAARGRGAQRRTSDRRTDARRRTLVGARLPREQAERCRAAADKLGVSLYRFALEALEAGCQRAEGLASGPPDGNEGPAAGERPGGRSAAGQKPGGRRPSGASHCSHGRQG